jgi:hypothetical protein
LCRIFVRVELSFGAQTVAVALDSFVDVWMLASLAHAILITCLATQRAAFVSSDFVPRRDAAFAAPLLVGFSAHTTTTGTVVTVLCFELPLAVWVVVSLAAGMEGFYSSTSRTPMGVQVIMSTSTPDVDKTASRW